MVRALSCALERSFWVALFGCLAFALFHELSRSLALFARALALDAFFQMVSLNS